jgi:hypothetical protein
MLIRETDPKGVILPGMGTPNSDRLEPNCSDGRCETVEERQCILEFSRFGAEGTA